MKSEVVLVISNVPGVEGLKRAKRAGILALVMYFKVIFYNIVSVIY